MSAEHEQNHICGRYFACVDGEPAIVAGVVDDIVSSGILLNKKAVAIARVGLVTVFGIGRNLHFGCVSIRQTLRIKHHIVAECLFPFDKFIDRSVPINKGNGIYSIFENSGPIFLDATHYTNRGGCVIGKYIMDTVVNDK